MVKYIFKLIVQKYLRFLTKLVLWRHRPLIIAIAGTTNKTFCKEMILQELGRGPNVRGNPKSFNTEIGLPLAVLFLPSGYSSITRWVDILLTGTCLSVFSRRFPKVLVLELGVDRKGDMRYLLSMVKPRIAVVTTIDRSFPENDTTLDDMADEISLLVKSVPENGTVFLNADDERVSALHSSANCRVVKYGRAENADAKISQVLSVDGGQSYTLEYNGQVYQFQTERFGWHNIAAGVIAKIVAREVGKFGFNNDK